MKIPATQEGLSAITAALAEGVSVNVTLIFSVERYRESWTPTWRAWNDGCADGRTSAASPRSPASSSPASTPRSTSGWRRSDRRGAGAARQGRGRELPARLRRVRRGLPGTRWAALTAQGAQPQRPLWASTGVKNPRLLRHHVRDRARRADTVNTMPEKTLLAVRRPRRVRATRSPAPLAQAQEVFDALERVGIDLDRRLPHAGGRGRREVREVVARAARHRQGPARRP